MPTTEAQKRATNAYRLRLKNSENGDVFAEKCRGYARKSFNKMYRENEEFRIAKLAYANSREYYLNNNDQFLRCIRRLYIEKK